MDVKRPFYDDLSFWVLIFTNGATITYTIIENWPLITIMLVYWVQSCIIGFFNVIRILSLKEFSTEGYYINDKPVAPTEQTKRKSAYFFAFHYGFFHAIYAVFLLTNIEGVSVHHVLFGGIVFFVDHLFSFRYNRERDQKKIQNLGRLMAFPYARVVPMHLVIVLFGVFLSGALPLLVFLGLKTLADVIMHVVEHY
ncbi:MAG: hypothetical protein AYK19_05320 [Theionarchaea archaeon DG-70-1]|nr:MAG: hypothetical protein AYK19_05320 [Theionarchaea archaeon DG-70-1]